MSAVSGSPTQVKTSCATLAEMGGTPDDAFLDGEVAYVSSVRRYFQIVRDDPTLAANGSTVIATFSGNGYWVALDFQSDAWSYQPTWYIDGTNGNDENDGATSVTALRSWAEFRRRVRLLAVSMTVYILSDLAEVVTGTFSTTLPSNILTIEGVPTVLATSTNVTTFVNPTGNNRGTVTAGGIDFSLYPPATHLPHPTPPVPERSTAAAQTPPAVGGATTEVAPWICMSPVVPVTVGVPEGTMNLPPSVTSTP